MRNLQFPPNFFIAIWTSLVNNSPPTLDLWQLKNNLFHSSRIIVHFLQKKSYLCRRIWFGACRCNVLIKRESGASPGQSRCCELQPQSFHKMPLPLWREGGKRRSKSEDLPIHWFWKAFEEKTLQQRFITKIPSFFLAIAPLLNKKTGRKSLCTD